MLQLFEQYPPLKENLPYVSLGEFPTPVEKLERLGQAINVSELYVKRDDLSGKLYGGNKIRALEFLFGDALRTKSKHVMVGGFPASCQALAQAIYAPQAGLQSTAFLFPQMVSQQGRQHLLMYQSISAEVYPIGSIFGYLARHLLKSGRLPKLLEASTPLGMIGYVNAGFELKQQVEQGLLAEPDVVYVGLATLGTAVGLLLGLKAAGMKTGVIGVDLGGKVFGKKVATPDTMADLFRKTNALLIARCPSFPKIDITPGEFNICAGYERGEESLITPAGRQAMLCAKEFANLQLDEMFTANAFAALLDHAEAKQLADKTVVWWNSYSSRDFTDKIASADYRLLPKYFHQYFEKDISPAL